MVVAKATAGSEASGDIAASTSRDRWNAARLGAREHTAEREPSGSRASPYERMIATPRAPPALECDREAGDGE
jgi:hypothetical protein